VFGNDFAKRAMNPLAVTALVVGLTLSLPARAETGAPVCDAPIDLIRLAIPLSHLAHKLATREPITIVAIGSSSTAGAGASSPTASYPSRLAVEFKQQFPDQKITVLNRGVNGEEVLDMLKRFDKGVIAEKPTLVLWQFGTNSVVRDAMFSDHGAAIRDGINKLHAAGADVVLIDPQFAPKVIVKPEATQMIDLIAATAKSEGVDLFRRFQVMQRWYRVDHMPFAAFVSPDGLHMNDWSYACLAKALKMAIVEAAQRPVISATVTPHLAVRNPRK
jgi:acyl-CoA thioesterase-1